MTPPSPQTLSRRSRAVNGTGPGDAAGARAASQRELAPILSRRQLHLRDAQLALVRQQGQHRGDLALGEVELARERGGCHPPVALEAASHLALDLGPPAIHAAPPDVGHLTAGRRVATSQKKNPRWVAQSTAGGQDQGA